MTWVHARRGPLAGRRVEISDDDVKAATADDGWAQAFEPGTVLEVDSAAPFDPKWKIPGVEMPIVEGKTVKAQPPKEDKPASKKKT